VTPTAPSRADGDGRAPFFYPSVTSFYACSITSSTLILEACTVTEGAVTSIGYTSAEANAASLNSK